MLAQLRLLARAYGIQIGYYGLGGIRHQASEETLLAVLRALGAELNSLDDVTRAQRAHRRELWARLLEPVSVLPTGSPASIEVRLPVPLKPSHLDCELHLENGPAYRWTVDWEQGEPTGRLTIDSIPVERRRVTLPVLLPLGYHRLSITAGRSAGDALLIVPSGRAFTPPGRRRDWGVFVPVYALGTDPNQTVGNLGDLQRLTTWTASQGGRVVGTTPLLGMFDEEPVEPSPYSPLSKLVWNELYLDLGRLTKSSSVSRELGHPDMAPEHLMRPPRAELIDYEQALRAQRGVLQPMSQQFFQGPAQARHEFEAFIAANPLVSEYARFRALRAQFGVGLPQHADRSRAHSVSGVSHKQVFDYHRYVQWLIYRQLEETRDSARSQGVALYFDLPVGVRRDGFDPWYENLLFAAGASVGAPPDPGFPSGQNWELPPIIPEESRQQGHRYFIACIRHQLRVASMLRIDHVMGLHRLFWIPAGGDSSDGAYVRYPAEEYYAILKLESHRHHATIVGEDLGIVPREVRAAMGRHGLHRLHVLQLELLDPTPPLADPPVASVASLNTHDMPTVAGFFTRPDGHHYWTKLASHLQARGLLTGENPDLREVLAACYAWLGRSRARVVLANLEDLWLETAPQNVPGPDVGNPNWRRRLRHDLDEMAGLPEVRALVDVLATARQAAD